MPTSTSIGVTTLLVSRMVAIARSILGNSGSLRNVATVTVGFRCRVMSVDPAIGNASSAARRKHQGRATGRCGGDGSKSVDVVLHAHPFVREHCRRARGSKNLEPVSPALGPDTERTWCNTCAWCSLGPLLLIMKVAKVVPSNTPRETHSEEW
jgi:hypothetical protein